MGNVKKTTHAKRPSRGLLFGAGAVIVLIAIILIVKGGFGSKNISTANGGNLVIPAVDITSRRVMS